MSGSTVVITITLAIGDNGFQNCQLLAQCTVQPLWVLAAHPFCNLQILPPNHYTVVSLPSSQGKECGCGCDVGTLFWNLNCCCLLRVA